LHREGLPLRIMEPCGLLFDHRSGSTHRTEEEEEEVKLFSEKIPQIEGNTGEDRDIFMDDIVDLSEIFSILSWLLVLLWS
jgi:hypothetical protein